MNFKVVTVLASLAFAGVLFVNFCWEMTWILSVNAILTSIVAAYIFYILVSYLPERKRKNIVKNSFSLHFTNFKRELIGLFICIADKFSNPELESKLYDIKEFKLYFKEPSDEVGQTKWNKVENTLQNERVVLQKVLVEMKVLRDETQYLLNNIYMDDENVFLFFKRLSRSIYEIEQIIDQENPEYDDISLLSGFLWEMFSGWNLVKGYSERDVFEEIMSRI